MTPAAPRASCSPINWLLLEFLPRLPVAFIFLYAGWGKANSVHNIETFVREVRAYEIGPVLASNAIAYVVPWIELVGAALLVIGLWGREVRWLLGLMLAFFTVIKGYALARGLPIECGCVPADSFLFPLFTGITGLLTNVVLIGFLLMAGLAERSRRRPAAPVKAPELAPATV